MMCRQSSPRVYGMIKINKILAILVASMAMVVTLAQANAARRIVLLIGNADYTGVSRLRNPANDADLIASAFMRAGFDKVDKKLDLTRQEMIAALRAFEDDAASADIAVVYFSGHGIEIGGENYIVPIDARLASDRDVQDEAISLSRVLQAVEGAKRLRLVILDACRNNPFVTRMTRLRSTKSVTRGLAAIEPPMGDMLVAYAAKAGTVAFDGGGPNSPFARALANRLLEPGVDIRIALGRVRDDVLVETSNSQEPFSYGSIGGATITLRDPTPVAPHVDARDAGAAQPSEADVWRMVKDARDVGMIREFLFRNPNSRFREEALNLLAALAPPAQPVQVRRGAESPPGIEAPRPVAPLAKPVPKPKAAAPRAAKRATPAKRPRSTSNCFTFNGGQFCE